MDGVKKILLLELYSFPYHIVAAKGTLQILVNIGPKFASYAVVDVIAKHKHVETCPSKQLLMHQWKCQQLLKGTKGQPPGTPSEGLTDLTNTGACTMPLHSQHRLSI